MFRSRLVQINLEPFVDHVYRFALSLTQDRAAAEDLAQSCLLKACEKQTQLGDQNATKAWLFQILLNLWKDQIKRKQIAREPGADIENLSKGTPTPFQIVTQNENHIRLLNLIQTLPERQRTVLHLSAVEQLSIREIAMTVNSTENAVKANLSIARKTLRKLLAQPDVTQKVSQQ